LPDSCLICITTHRLGLCPEDEAPAGQPKIKTFTPYQTSGASTKGTKYHEGSQRRSRFSLCSFVPFVPLWCIISIFWGIVVLCGFGIYSQVSLRGGFCRSNLVFSCNWLFAGDARLLRRLENGSSQWQGASNFWLWWVDTLVNKVQLGFVGTGLIWQRGAGLQKDIQVL
jgi:hypothetical protein